MSWYRADVELSSHVKLSRLARRLEVPTYAALGIVHTLWAWCKLHRPTGDLDGLDATDLAHIIGWTGDQDHLLAALTAEGTTATGFIDLAPMRVHDWDHYQPDEARRVARSLAAKAGPHKAWHEDKGVYSHDCPYCLEAHNEAHHQARPVKNCPWCTGVRSHLLKQTDAKNANALFASQTQSECRANAKQTHSKTLTEDAKRIANAKRPLSDAEQTQSNAKRPLSDAEQTQSIAKRPLSDAEQTQSECRANANQTHSKRSESKQIANQTHSKRSATAKQTRAFEATSTSTSTSTSIKRDGEKPPSTVPALTTEQMDQFLDDWMAYPMRKGRRAGLRKHALAAWTALTPDERNSARIAAKHLADSGQYPPNMDKFLSLDEDGEYRFMEWLAPATTEDKTNQGKSADDFAPNYSPDDPLKDF